MTQLKKVRLFFFKKYNLIDLPPPLWGFFWYRCFYPNQTRDSVSSVCGIFKRRRRRRTMYVFVLAEMVHFVVLLTLFLLKPMIENHLQGLTKINQYHLFLFPKRDEWDGCMTYICWLSLMWRKEWGEGYSQYLRCQNKLYIIAIDRNDYQHWKFNHNSISHLFSFFICCT